MADSKGTKSVIILDGDKGIYTLEEVAAICKKAGLTVKISEEDGTVDSPQVA